MIPPDEVIVIRDDDETDEPSASTHASTSKENFETPVIRSKKKRLSQGSSFVRRIKPASANEFSDVSNNKSQKKSKGFDNEYILVSFFFYCYSFIFKIQSYISFIAYILYFLSFF